MNNMDTPLPENWFIDYLNEPEYVEINVQSPPKFKTDLPKVFYSEFQGDGIFLCDIDTDVLITMESLKYLKDKPQLSLVFPFTGLCDEKRIMVLKGNTEDCEKMLKNGFILGKNLIVKYNKVSGDIYDVEVV